MALQPVQSALKAAIERAKAGYSSDSSLDAEWQAWTWFLHDRIHRNAQSESTLVNEAFLTFNRTLHGFARTGGRDGLLQQSRDLLQTQIDALCALDHPTSREKFDTWHEDTCQSLLSVWTPVFPLTIGQAQKWVNILLKYHAAFGNQGSRPAIRKQFLDVLHTPIDNVVYNLLSDSCDVALVNSGPNHWFLDVQRRPRWSRIQEYSFHYMPLQKLLRHLADEVGIPPCSIELVGWDPANL